MSDARAALERGRALLLVTPPAVEQADAVWELLLTPGRRPGAPRAVIVTADQASAEEWADAAPAAGSIHPVTSLARTARLLKEGAVEVLAGAPEDLQALAARSVLKLAAVGTLVLSWPEWLVAGGRLPALEQLLGELREAQRIVLAWNPAALEDLLERYARRPHVVGDLPVGEDARPLPPVGPARYAIVPRARRSAARREVLDALNRPTVFEWRRGDVAPKPVDAVICLDLPTRLELAALVERAGRGDIVLLISPSQLPYARSIAAPLVPLPLAAARARAQSRAEEIRTATATRIEAGGLEPELALLEPLFERFDAAEVAAALLAVGSRPSAIGSAQPQADSREPAAPSEAWVRVFVGIGKKDKVAARDLVGALTREVGLAREDIGRIELRDTFSLISVVPRAADQAITGLSRVMLRGRRVMAHRDRGT